MPERLSIAVLAGGASRRMGRDKGLAEIAGRPMALWALDAVLAALHEPPAEAMFIANSEGYEALKHLASGGGWVRPGVRVIGDLRPGLGPLAGIETALNSSAGRSVVVIACDMPLADPALIAELIAAAGEAGTVAALPVTPQGAEPCLAVYTGACLAVVTNLLDEGKLEARAIGDAIADSGVGNVTEIAVTDPGQLAGLRNVNTPAELDAAGALLAGRA